MISTKLRPEFAMAVEANRHRIGELCKSTFPSLPQRGAIWLQEYRRVSQIKEKLLALQDSPDVKFIREILRSNGSWSPSAVYARFFTTADVVTEIQLSDQFFLRQSGFRVRHTQPNGYPGDIKRISTRNLMNAGELGDFQKLENNIQLAKMDCIAGRLKWNYR